MTDRPNLPIPNDTPRAEVVRWSKPHVQVRCPYCDGLHPHQIAFNAHRPQWRAPGCGIGRSATDRLRGYAFTI